jgi:DNA-binding response OmpR family regulator
MEKVIADPALRMRTCFSCMLKEADYLVIPELFDQGLMSWHENTDAPDEIAQAVYKLQKLADQTRNPAIFSWHFYRNYLKQKLDWERLIDTAETLLKKFPQELVLRLHQIEAYAKLGKQDVAKSMLEQFDFFDPELAAQVVQLRGQVLQESDNAHKLLAVQYQMRTALVVDPFPDSSQQIQNMLREFGFRNLQVFGNGDQAAQFVSRQSFDIAIIEWQCPGLGGPFLIQRIRQAGFVDVPIIVLTSVLDRADTQLVKDMGVAQVLKRPLKAQQLTMATAWTITQTRVPTEATSYERKVQEYLNKGDLEKAKSMFRTYVTFDTRDPLKEKFLRASILYQEQRYEEAKVLLIETTHDSRGDNVHVAAMLARCLIQLGEFQTALALLKKVTALSPKNIERLCTLSQLALQTKDVKAAESSLSAAEALDPDSRQVVETQAKVATFTGNAQRAMELMKNLPNVEDVIVYMNNMAVTFV